ncbi:MAG: bis-aminopropyl spermidine synthase family protein [Chloroflexia bacterium]
MEGEEMLEQVARAARLREGPPGVAAFLRTLYRRSPLPTQELARRLGWPVPVAAAVRGELERAGLLRRTPGGSALSERGTAFAREVLGLERIEDPLCPTCAGRRIVIHPARWGPLLACLEEVHRANPPVDTTLDQSHGLPETALRRALLMYREGALEGKDILLLGDDDLVSVAVGLIGESGPRGQGLGTKSGESAENGERRSGGAGWVRRLVVVDVDGRFLEHIAAAGRRFGFAVETVLHDLRDPLPETLREAFDTVETDPPYTLPGLRLFLSRALEALRPGGGRDIFLSYAPRDPEGQRALLRECVEMGLAPYSVTPDFNRYVGTGTLGGSGQFLHLRTTPEARPAVPGRYTGPLYTMEVHPALRLYRCSACGEVYRVGPEGDFPTIEHLQAHGCPRCGGDTFRIRKKII